MSYRKIFVADYNFLSFSKENYFVVIKDIIKEDDLYNETKFNSTVLLQVKHTEERFSYRANHLKKVCKRDEHVGLWSNAESKRYRTEWVRNDNFVIVSERSFLLCAVPKCGSSSWHVLARDMREPLSAGHEFGWQDRQKNTEISQELDPSDGVRLLKEKNGFRAITVRHPFAKMISGWNDKLDSGETYGDFVLEAYPHMQKYASNRDLKHVIAFEDLADYIADYGTDVDNLDYHFMPVHNLCQPCLYPYNYILKLETLALDEAYLKNILNVSQMPWHQKGSTYFSANHSHPAEVIRSYFRKVKTSTIQKLMKIYYYDFALFGYTFDIDTLTAGGFF